MDIKREYYYVTPLNAVRNKRGNRQAVINALQKDWGTVKAEYRTLRSAKAGAADRSAAKWDYSRLQYERDQARPFLKSASLGTIWKQYENLESANDRHKLRAFVEEGAAILDKRDFQGADVIKRIDILDDMQKMISDLTTTPEQKELDQQENILSLKVQELHKATQEARGLVAERMPAMAMNGAGEPVPGGGVEGIFAYLDSRGQQADPFAEMTKGVSFKRDVDSTTGEVWITPVLDWD